MDIIIMLSCASGWKEMTSFLKTSNRLSLQWEIDSKKNLLGLSSGQKMLGNLVCPYGDSIL
jgi:hypothetical protein